MRRIGVGDSRLREECVLVMFVSQGLWVHGKRFRGEEFHVCVCACVCVCVDVCVDRRTPANSLKPTQKINPSI